MSGKIVKVSGPLVVATGLEDANMADVVRVGEQRLIGEILTMNGDSASIQVYEETSGLGPVSYTHLPAGHSAWNAWKPWASRSRRSSWGPCRTSPVPRIGVGCAGREKKRARFV